MQSTDIDFVIYMYIVRESLKPKVSKLSRALPLFIIIYYIVATRK